jgi:hypothetical protein
MIEPKRNPDWYRVKHNYAALHANWAADHRKVKAADSSERGRHQDIARAESRELALRASEQLTFRWPPRVNRELREFLKQSILPAALLLYAAASANRAETGEQTAPGNPRELHSRLKSNQLTAKAAMAYVDGDPDLSLQVVYAFACAHAQRGEFERSIERLHTAMKMCHGRSAIRQIAESTLQDASFDLLLQQRNKACRNLKRELEEAAGPRKPPQKAPKAQKKR